MVLDPAGPPTPRCSKNGRPPREITVIDSPEKLGLPNCRGRITQGGAVIMAEESANAKKRSTEEFYRQPEGVVVSGLEEVKHWLAVWERFLHLRAPQGGPGGSNPPMNDYAYANGTLERHGCVLKLGSGLTHCLNLHGLDETRTGWYKNTNIHAVPS